MDSSDVIYYMGEWYKKLNFQFHFMDSGSAVIYEVDVTMALSIPFYGFQGPARDGVVLRTFQFHFMDSERRDDVKKALLVIFDFQFHFMDS